MNKLFFIILFSLFAKTFFAQPQDSLVVEQKPLEYKRNAVYLEGLGNAGYGDYSINYERKILSTQDGDEFLTSRVGFSTGYGAYDIPILINHVGSQKKKHHFEIGLGATLRFLTYYYSGNNHNIYTPTSTYLYTSGFTANLMYRYQKSGGKFLFRIGWTPTFYNFKKDIWDAIPGFYIFYPGISFGFLF